MVPWVGLAIVAAVAEAGCPSAQSFVDGLHCTADAECDDGNACTTHACGKNGACTYAAANVGMSCATGALTCNGSGQCDACDSDQACGATTPCGTFTCEARACKAVYAPEGTAVPDHTPGDCMKPQCDGHGGTVLVPNAADVPPSPDPCTLHTCSASGPTQSYAQSGTTCSSGVCDGTGACVACVADAQCTMGTSPSCSSTHTCISCSDGVQNGDETGVDCGGSHCLECAGEACTDFGQCKSQDCKAGICQ
jgi:hypothetical protein